MTKKIRVKAVNNQKKAENHGSSEESHACLHAKNNYLRFTDKC